MGELLFGETACRGEQIRYYVLTEMAEAGEDYGLRVEYAGEAETIRRVTPSHRGMDELLGTMVRGGVTPVCAREVVEDWLLR